MSADLPPATTAADAYAHAAELARTASMRYTLTGDQGPEWVRRDVVLDLAERLTALAEETT